MADAGRLREQWGLVVKNIRYKVKTVGSHCMDMSGWIGREYRIGANWGTWGRYDRSSWWPAGALAHVEHRRPPLKERVAAIMVSEKRALYLEQALSVALWQPLKSWPRPLPLLVLQMIFEQLCTTDT